MGMLASKQSILTVPTHTIHYGFVIAHELSAHKFGESFACKPVKYEQAGSKTENREITNHEIIDNVLFLVMRGPKTFTGQDTVEITCHNNPFIIEQIIE